MRRRNTLTPAPSSTLALVCPPHCHRQRPSLPSSTGPQPPTTTTVIAASTIDHCHSGVQSMMTTAIANFISIIIALMLMSLSRRRQCKRHRVATALPLSAQCYVAVTLLSPVWRRQCKWCHVAIALPLLSWRWRRSCLAVAIFVSTHRTMVLRTTTEAMEEAVMPTSAAG